MLYVANDTNLELLGLQTEDGTFITDAVLTCTVTDSTGATVATVTLSYLGTAVTVNNLTYTDGNYRGVLSGATSLTANANYLLTYTASNYGLKILHFEQATTRVG